MPDLGTEVSVPLPTNGELKYQRDRDYLRSSLNVLMRHGRRPTRGYDCTFRSTIPINAGTASSSAMILAWLRFLLATQGEGECDGLTLACMANRAEVLEFGEPGGIMDHVTCSLGGTLYIECRDPVQEALPAPRRLRVQTPHRRGDDHRPGQSRCDVEPASPPCAKSPRV